VPSCLARRPGRTDLEELDFLQVSSRREAIHARKRGLCFYCLRRFVARGRVLDHVVPLVRKGSNSYRNLVSAVSNATRRREKPPQKIFCSASIACAA
jgi:5-methylcytosine-specific restriction endonuclease McrA